MARTSSGLLLFRRSGDALEVLAVHPGGPFWARKDQGAWSIPKGEVEEGEDPVVVASREFTEELGVDPPDPVTWVDLGEIVQKGGKRVRCFAARGDLDVRRVVSNTFEMEWPPRSGRTREFPEVDRAEWFPVSVASGKLNPAQVELIDRLQDRL